MTTNSNKKINVEEEKNKGEKNRIDEVITFGCRLNHYESQIIKDNIKAANLKNVVVINTCTVTAEAQKQAKQQIRKIKRDNPDIRIIVTGCAAQNDPETFGKMEEVDRVLGNQEKLDFKNYKIDADSRVLVNDIMSIKETANHLITNFEGKTRAFIQIQNGCDHRCTFCIIPFGRGNSRSTPIGVISNQIEILLNGGYKEIVLTGVDVTDYGKDLPGSPTLAQLIRRLLSIHKNLSRLRLSSIDVAEIDEDLFNLMAKEERLMPHFHISLQAGDDMILKRMKRRHNRTQVIDFCKKLRELRSDVAFGADIIAGFPTETDEMFENTKNLVLEADLQYLHVFPYSKREGTPASKMPQVEKQIIKQRAAQLRQIGEAQIKKFMKKFDGSYHNVLVESSSVGHATNFIPVKCEGINAVEGSIIKMKLVYNNSSKEMIGHEV
jgi:threonylcarbamoyladenosine tRNA methylthiotransferase MtaB